MLKIEKNEIFIIETLKYTYNKINTDCVILSNIMSFEKVLKYRYKFRKSKERNVLVLDYIQ